MVIYLVPVTDYLWTPGNVVVQCPLPDLTFSTAPPVIRPLAGVNKGEPRFVDAIGDLSPCTNANVYEAEAHGIFVPPDSPLERIPVWIPVRQQMDEAVGDQPSKRKNKKQAGPSTDEPTMVIAADLRTSERLKVNVDRICWVPSREAPDGRLCTIIAQQLTVGRKKVSHVLLQDIRSPGSAKFSLLTAEELSSFVEISSARKKQLFEVQLMMVLKRKKSLSPPLRGALDLVLSSEIRENGWRTFWNVLDDEDLDVPRRPSSECSEDSFFDIDDSLSDGDSIYGSPRSSLAAGSPSISHLTNRIYSYDQSYANTPNTQRRLSCRCTYPKLYPTLADPYPAHRHVEDDECPLGNKHNEHCVFASHSPDVCVIPNGSHKHCSSLDQLSNADETLDYDRMRNSNQSFSPVQLSETEHGSDSDTVYSSSSQDESSDDGSLADSDMTSDTLVGSESPASDDFKLDDLDSTENNCEENFWPEIQDQQDLCYYPLDAFPPVYPIFMDSITMESSPIMTEFTIMDSLEDSTLEMDLLPDPSLTTDSPDDMVWNPQFDRNAYLTPEPPELYY